MPRDKTAAHGKIMAAAREEFFARTAEHPYVCPIPEGAVPTLAD